MAIANGSIGFEQKLPLPISGALQELVDDMGRQVNSNGSRKFSGIETGFSDLDSCISGMRPGSLIVIASRPSMGKTTFAMNIASHVALNAKFPVLMFSMDLSSIAIAGRLASQIGGIETYKLRTGELDEADHKNLDGAIEKLRDNPFFIVDTPSLAVQEIIVQSQDFITHHGKPRLIIIDHLQLIETIGSVGNAVEAYEEVMATLKALARQTDIRVILLSNLSRKVDTRRNKRPRMSDFPARAIGQYADLLMFIYRDEVYDPDSSDKNTAEITIARHRYGSTGVITLGAMKLKLGEFSNHHMNLNTHSAVSR